MEQVLDVYKRPYDKEYPVICMDESPKQLIEEGKKEHANDLSGKGAELCGGRWNTKGIAMLYTCQSRALCLAEVAVHLPLSSIPDDYYLISIVL